MLTFSASGATELFVKIEEGAITIEGSDQPSIEVRLDTDDDVAYDDISFRQDGGRVVLEVKAAADIELVVPPAISVTLFTGDGHIEVDGFAGALQARTDDGHIEVRGRFHTLNLATGDGDIEAEVDSGSRMAVGWTLHTDDGSIELRLPRDFAADLDASTRDGSVNVDFPLNAARVQDMSVNGKLNGGGLPLIAHTNDGHIEIDLT
jgi:hypothetical protein